MDKYDISETRDIFSCYLDQCDLFGTNRGIIDRLTDDEITTLKNSLLDGETLLKGQIVTFKSQYGDSVLGTIPAIVTNILRVNTVTTEYTFKILTGDLNGDLTETTLKDVKLPEVIDITSDVSSVLSAIIDGRLGNDTLYGLQSLLGVNKLYVLDLDEEKYTTFM
jgi:hypothetical protein